VDVVTYTKRSRTQVYSGKKTASGPQVVMSLFDMSMKILIDNIDAIEEVGGVPYLILEPLLQKSGLLAGRL
jgi:transcription elongation factor B polypeptide 3